MFYFLHDIKFPLIRMKSVWAASQGHWERICSYVNHAVVFIDNRSAEALHWHGGLLKLVNAGATDVKEFSSFEASSCERILVFLRGRQCSPLNKEESGEEILFFPIKPLF